MSDGRCSACGDPLVLVRVEDPKGWGREFYGWRGGRSVIWNGVPYPLCSDACMDQWFATHDDAREFFMENT